MIDNPGMACQDGSLVCMIYLVFVIVFDVVAWSALIYLLWKDRADIRKEIKEEGFWRFIWGSTD